MSETQLKNKAKGGVKGNSFCALSFFLIEYSALLTELSWHATSSLVQILLVQRILNKIGIY